MIKVRSRWVIELIARTCKSVISCTMSCTMSCTKSCTLSFPQWYRHAKGSLSLAESPIAGVWGPGSAEEKQKKKNKLPMSCTEHKIPVPLDLCYRPGSPGVLCTPYSRLCTPKVTPGEITRPELRRAEVTMTATG